MIVDTHAHLDMPQFDSDRREVIQRARDAGVELLLSIGTGSPEGDSIAKTIRIAEEYPFVKAAIGVSPHDAKLVTPEYLDELEAVAGHPSVVLWGEIGLDYYHDLSPRDVQKDIFRRQLRIANRLDLPVAIHCRDSWPDAIEILREEYPHGYEKVVMHSFTGSKEQALEAAALGYWLSFSGIATFRNADALRAAACAIHLDRMLVETDCPYLAPVPHRGKRNEPAWVVDTARALAGIRGMDYEDFASAICRNVGRLLKTLDA
jgi:TatD DNase family protein